MDGWTIVRFAHAYESGGGLEQYLADVNLALGQRNRMTIVQMQMTTDHSRLQESTETIGDSHLVKIPLYVAPESKHESINSAPPRPWEHCKAAVYKKLLFTAPVFGLFTRAALKQWQVPRRSGEPDNAGARFQEILGRFPVKLVLLHTGGGADTSEILAAAKRAKVPAAIVHHFANERFQTPALARQTMEAGAIGGVTGVGVPGFLRGRFTNLADGIDIIFFQRQNARPVTPKPAEPVLFLPARIMATKGQFDLVRAGGELLRQGMKFQIAFAGRVDSDEFLALLKREIAAAGLSDRVVFVGQLDAAGLRDWYAASAILAFPTRHHEGLPRILLEAQAMQLPVVVNDIGGTSEGLIDGQSGYLVSVGDQQGLVARLGRLLRDADQCRQFGVAGRKLVESRFSLESLADRHENFYDRAVTS